MSFLVPNEGEAFFLDRFVAKGSYSFSSSLGMRLFNANITPSETDTVSTYYPASVATFAGYAPISLSAASWTITEGNPSVASYSNQQIGSNPVFTSNTDDKTKIFTVLLCRMRQANCFLWKNFQMDPT